MFERQEVKIIFEFSIENLTQRVQFKKKLSIAPLIQFNFFYTHLRELEILNPIYPLKMG